MRKFIDITGQRFGRYTVVERSPDRGCEVYWKCECDCGTTREVRGRTLTSGASKSCGCSTKAIHPNDTKKTGGKRGRKQRYPNGELGDRPDLTGKTFGCLVVKEFSRNPISKIFQWLCECSCGGTIFAKAYDLHRNHVRSCGCRRLQGVTHGKSNTPEYRSWACMVHRCTNPDMKGYKNYGGRGITVCSRWRESVENFIDDMGQRPVGTTIDRIDNNDGYHCGHCEDCRAHGWVANCRWATWYEQSKNRRKPSKMK